MNVDQEEVDRRRLHRERPWAKQERGFYSTADSMHGVRRVKKNIWEAGVRQPYHSEGEYDFSSNPRRFRRLRDAQAGIESEPQRQLSTQFYDRRGL